VLAWPIALIVVLVIYRVPLTRLIDRIRHASVGGVAIKLADDAAAVAQDAAERLEQVTTSAALADPAAIETLDEIRMEVVAAATAMRDVATALYPSATRDEAWHAIADGDPARRWTLDADEVRRRAGPPRG
jgi:hypothetical protein